MELAKELTEEFLTCNICLEVYKDPKQLPCLHSFCRKCLADFINAKVGSSGDLRVPCPVCRKCSLPPNPNPQTLHLWADSYPDNFFISSLVSSLKPELHKGGAAEAKAAPSQTGLCSVHTDSSLTGYCPKQNQALCRQCEAQGHERCAFSHLDPADTQQEVNQRVKGHQESVEKLSTRVSHLEETLVSLPNTWRLEKEEVELEITDYFARLKSQLKKMLLTQEKEALLDLKTAMAKEEKQAATTRTECQTLAKSLKGTNQAIDKASSGSPFQAMGLLSNMERQLSNMESKVGELEEGLSRSHITFQTEEGVLSHLETLKLGRILSGHEEPQEEEPESPPPEPPDSPPITVILPPPPIPPRPPPSSSSPPSVPQQGFQFAQADASERTGQRRGRARSLGRSVSREYASIPHPAPSAPYLPAPAVATLSFSRPPTSAPPSAPPPFLWSPSPQTEQRRSASSSPPRSSSSSDRSQESACDLWQTAAFTSNLPHETRRGGVVAILEIFRYVCAILDRFNRSIKVMDLNGRLLTFIRLTQHEPFDMALLSDGLLGIVCPATNALVHVSFSSAKELFLSRVYTTRCGYVSLVALPEQRLVASVCRPYGPPAIHILNWSGGVLQQLNTMLTYPRFLDTTPSDLLLVSDWKAPAILLLDQNGMTLSAYRGTDQFPLFEPMGITVGYGVVLVIDHKTCKVHELDSSTLAFKRILPLEGVRDPRIITLASRRERGDASIMVIAMVDGSGTVGVYESNFTSQDRRDNTTVV